MNTIDIIIIAFGLAMDAFAVSLSAGFSFRDKCFRQSVRMAFFFGIFQALMPVLGWLGGLGFRNLIMDFDHWIIFAILSYVGGKMILDSRKEGSDRKMFNPLKTAFLLTLALATSIDAFSIGITFAFLHMRIFFPVMVIGLVTFVLSFAGVHIGNRFGHFFERKMEVAGGIILIFIGGKILFSHLTF